MLSDAALAVAVDASTKWLYNSSRRLKRPLRRSVEDAAWWRLTHHLSGRLGVQLADAARAADLLLAQNQEVSRVRLRSTPDDTVAIGVELSRFHDGAALAAAAALHLAVPRRRGRPPRLRSATRVESPGTTPAVRDSGTRLSQAVATIQGGVSGPLIVADLLSSLHGGGFPFVVGGGLATAFHEGSSTANSIDIIVDMSGRHARSISQLLQHLGARPRGVLAREGFTFDSALVRSVPCLALVVGGFALNVARALPGVGEFPQVNEASSPVTFEGRPYRILTREGLFRAAAALARSVGAT